MEATTFGFELVRWVSLLTLLGVSYAAVMAATLCGARAQREHEMRLQRRLEIATDIAVRAIQQIVVDQRKDASRDRRLAIEQQTELRSRALELTKLHLGPAVQRELRVALRLDTGALDALLETGIEAAVHRLRNAAPHELELGGTAGPAVPFVA